MNKLTTWHVEQFFDTCEGIRKFLPFILHYLFHLASHLMNIKYLQTLEDRQLTSHQHIWVCPGVFQCPMLWQQLQPAEFLTNVSGGKFPAVMKWGEMNTLTGWYPVEIIYIAARIIFQLFVGSKRTRIFVKCSSYYCSGSCTDQLGTDMGILKVDR